MAKIPYSQIPLSSLTERMGRFVICLYIFLSYTATCGVLPSSLISITLYTTALIGVVCFILSGKLTIRDVYMKWVLIFFGFCFVTGVITIAAWNEMSWLNTLYEMFVMILIALAFTQCISSIRHIKMIGYSYVSGAVILMFLLYFTGQLGVDERLGESFMGNANTFAGMYMLALMITLWMLIYSKKILEKLILLGAIAVIYYAMFLSGGRKFIIVPLIFLYILLLLKRDERGRKHIIRYTLIIAAAVALMFYLIMNVPTLYNAIGYRMRYLINMIVGEGDIGASNAIRSMLMKAAFEKGFESPIWGHGFDSFRYYAAKNLNFAAYSHNNWTELWYNSGIIGLFCYYLLYVKFLSKAWKRRNEQNGLMHFVIAAVVSVFIFEYGAVTYYFYPIQIMLCLCSIMLSIKDGDNNGENKDVYTASQE